MRTCRLNKKRLGALLFIAAVVTAGCSASAKTEPYFGKIQPPEGQTLRYITGAEPQTLDPHFIGPTSFVCKPYVKNLVPNVLDQHDWRGVYIDHSVTAESLGVSSGAWRSKYFAFFSR